MQRRYIKKQVVQNLHKDKKKVEGLREEAQLKFSGGPITQAKLRKDWLVERYLFGYLDQVEVLESEVQGIFNLSKSDEAIIEDYEHFLAEQKQVYVDYRGNEKTELPLSHLKKYLEGRLDCINTHKKILAELKDGREFQQLHLFPLEQIEVVYTSH